MSTYLNKRPDTNVELFLDHARILVCPLNYQKNALVPYVSSKVINQSQTLLSKTRYNSGILTKTMSPSYSCLPLLQRSCYKDLKQYKSGMI